MTDEVVDMTCMTDQHADAVRVDAAELRHQLWASIGSLTAHELLEVAARTIAAATEGLVVPNSRLSALADQYLVGLKAQSSVGGLPPFPLAFNWTHPPATCAPLR